jgi:hypothetical protein
MELLLFVELAADGSREEQHEMLATAKKKNSSQIF